MRAAAEMFCTTSCPVLLKLEHASESLEGLLTQTHGPHPSVSGSVDVGQGLRINISSTFLIWALGLLKTVVHSIQGYKTDQEGEREVSKN